MWIFLNNAFLSIVAIKPEVADPRRFLNVRARLQGDIERVFPGARVEQDKGTDYRFRALIPRSRVVKAMDDAVLGIDYTNFKDSTREHWRHMLYMSVWHVMLKEQEARRPRRVKR